ncbi:MAG: hypothetical protein P8Q42_12170 [Flavobacteriales bacterium]|nr:hypothetical protein [Flavobacteriales bacterium]
MILLYLFTGLLLTIALSKMMKTWKLSSEIMDKRPNWVVRTFFGTSDFVADLVSLKVFN